MDCPYCKSEMKAGTAENITMHHMTLVFKENGEEIKLKNVFKKENTSAMIIVGDEVDAYYCCECKKLVVITDCM